MNYRGSQPSMLSDGGQRALRIESRVKAFSTRPDGDLSNLLDPASCGRFTPRSAADWRRLNSHIDDDGTTPRVDEAIRILKHVPDVCILFTDIDLSGGMDGIWMAASSATAAPPVEITITSGMTRPSAANMPSRCVFFSKPYDARKVAE